MESMKSVEIQYSIFAHAKSMSKVFTCSWGENMKYYFRYECFEHARNMDRIKYDEDCNSFSAPQHDIPNFTAMSEEELFQTSVVWDYESSFEFMVQLMKFAITEIYKMDFSASIVSGDKSVKVIEY